VATEGIYIPPVLRGCRFLGLEAHQHHTNIVFASEDPVINGGVVRVVVSARGRPEFYYSLYDPESETVVHYHGSHGDPHLDDALEVKGTND
jgi:hypothetical protein